jgi:hypothetical protein
MSTAQFTPTSRRTERVFQVVSYLLVSAMMACMAITVILFVQKYSPGFRGTFLPVLFFLITLERQFSYKNLQQLPVLGKRWIVWFSSQWVVILVVVKIVILLTQEVPSYPKLFQLWQVDFFTYFFDLDYLLAVIFVIVVWLFSGVFASLLHEMSLDEMFITFETAVQAPTDKPPARERLVGMIFGIGIGLVLLTALMRISLRMIFMGQMESMEIAPLPYLAAGAWNVLLFFVLGLILLSQSQLARLNALWSIRKVPFDSNLVGRWVGSSMVFIAILALIASLLPTNYSLGILTILAYIIQVIYFVIFFIFSGIYAGIIYLVSLLLSLFGRQQPENAPPLAPTMAPPPPPEVTMATGETLPWLELVKSLIFWVVFLVIVAFSLYQFLRQHEGAMNALRKFPGFSMITNFWKWLSGGARNLNERLGEGIRTGLQRLRERQIQIGIANASRFVNLRRLTPRQRVFFFFQAMTRRGSDRGLPRGAAQTPYEYAAALEKALPEVDEDVNALTEAFVSARYSRRDVNDNQAGVVKKYWDRIRRAIRGGIKPEA